MAKNLQDMSIEELEALNRELMAERAALKEKKAAIKAILDVKQAAKRAQDVLDGLSPAELAALKQVMRAEGIISDEAFGVPGSS